MSKTAIVEGMRDASFYLKNLYLLLFLMQREGEGLEGISYQLSDEFICAVAVRQSSSVKSKSWLIPGLSLPLLLKVPPPLILPFPF